MADNVKELMMDSVIKAIKEGKVKSVHIEMEDGDEHGFEGERETSSAEVCPECGSKMEDGECEECGYEADKEEAPKEKEMSPALKREMERHMSRDKAQHVKDEGDEVHSHEDKLKNIEKLKEYSKKK